MNLYRYLTRNIGTYGANVICKFGKAAQVTSPALLACQTGFGAFFFAPLEWRVAGKFEEQLVIRSGRVWPALLFGGPR
jgi:hypothetical protein